MVNKNKKLEGRKKFEINPSASKAQNIAKQEEIKMEQMENEEKNVQKQNIKKIK